MNWSQSNKENECQQYQFGDFRIGNRAEGVSYGHHSRRETKYEFPTSVPPPEKVYGFGSSKQCGPETPKVTFRSDKKQDDRQLSSMFNSESGPRNVLLNDGCGGVNNQSFQMGTANVFEPSSVLCNQSTSLGNQTLSTSMVIGSGYEGNKSSVLTKSQIAARHVFKDLPDFNGKVEDWPIFLSSLLTSTKTCGYSDDENLGRLQKTWSTVVFYMQNRFQVLWKHFS